MTLQRASRKASWLLEKIGSQPQPKDLDDIESDEALCGTDVHNFATEAYDFFSVFLKS